MLHKIFLAAKEKCDEAARLTLDQDVLIAIRDERKKYEEIDDGIIIKAHYYCGEIDRVEYAKIYAEETGNEYRYQPKKEIILDFLVYLKDNATEISDCILYALDKANQIKTISQNHAVIAAVDRYTENLRDLNTKILNL